MRFRAVFKCGFWRDDYCLNLCTHLFDFGVQWKMTVWAQFFDEMERLFQIRSIHNELKIVAILMENGPTASLDLHRASRRSISGHNGDLRRLRANGIVNCETGECDRREKIYDLEPDFRDRFMRFLEDYKTTLANDPRPVLRRAPRVRAKARSVPGYRSRSTAI